MLIFRLNPFMHIILNLEDFDFIEIHLYIPFGLLCFSFYVDFTQFRATTLLKSCKDCNIFLTVIVKLKYGMGWDSNTDI